MTKTCNDKGGNDKKLHLFYSFLIAAILGPLLAHIPPHNPWVASGCTFALTLLVGVGKELYDRRKGGHICVWDIVADAVGALCGVGLAWLAAYFLSADNFMQ